MRQEITDKTSFFEDVCKEWILLHLQKAKLVLSAFIMSYYMPMGRHKRKRFW